ncbi:MAG: transporter [Acidobacteria bacterium]|nr:MAG: transporter [Acidobacteriota bacterium]
MRQLVWLCIVAFTATPALAGPPFLTDDPEPVAYRHYEFYTFSTLDHSTGSYGIQLPAFEFNFGAAPNLQLHVVAPIALSVLDPEPASYGIGDIELGGKYRFFKEKGRRPQVGIFPVIELPSGNSRRNLGNGQVWARLPLWVQKTWGAWTTNGGAGYTVNHAPGMRDHIFGGWQIQRKVNKKLTLGAEWYTAGRDTNVARAPQLINAGGFYNFNENFSLLFTAGHSVHGDSHTVAYLGLYWTWGPAKDAEKSKPARPTHSSADFVLP